MLHLDGNPWSCDCRTAQNIQFFSQHPQIQAGEHGGKCQNPPALRQQTLRSLDVKNLHCYHATPIETREGMILNCDTNGESYKHVHWLYESMPLDMKLKGAYEHLDNGSLALYQTDMHVHRFQCAIDYIVGVSRPNRQVQARLASFASDSNRHSSSYEAPKFTYTPRDRSYREGASVKLNCEVLGQPRPQIKWTFQGKGVIIDSIILEIFRKTN